MKQPQVQFLKFQAHQQHGILNQHQVIILVMTLLPPTKLQVIKPQNITTQLLLLAAKSLLKVKVVVHFNITNKAVKKDLDILNQLKVLLHYINLK